MQHKICLDSQLAAKFGQIDNKNCINCVIKCIQIYEKLETNQSDPADS